MARSSAPVPDCPEPLDELARRLRPRLHAILARYGIPSQDWEDVLQNSLTITLRRWESLENPEGWLVRTLTNQCLMYWRSRRRRPETPADLPTLEAVGAAIPSPENYILDRHDVELYLARLPRHCQLVLRLRLSYGFGAAEIAAILGRSTGNVYSALHRCTKLLEKAGPPLRAGKRR